MPIYEYQCQACGERLEALQRLSEPPLATCAECGGDLKKLVSAPAFQFKGSGWYVTDYARQGNGGKDGEKKSSETGGASDGGNKDKAASGGSESSSNGSAKPAAKAAGGSAS